MRRLRSLVVAALTVCGGATVTTVASAAPPPVDPKQMSGIPRADSQVPAGTVTVRVLGEGGFSDPVVQTEVVLELTSADGKTTATRIAKTQGEGRATFSDLQEFAGGKAIARVELGGATVQSLPIELLPQAGSRVMLVEGAGTPTAGGPGAPAGAAGHAGDVPMPGQPFPMTSSPAGRLMIGSFDLETKRPIPDIDVTLTITPPEGEPIVREGKTDREGKLFFDNLLAPRIPEGSSLQVVGKRGNGEVLMESASFQMPTNHGVAIVLTESMPEPAAKSVRLSPPRVNGNLKPGTLMAQVVGPRGEPAANQKIVVVRKAAGGDTRTWSAMTNEQGIANLEDLPVAQDALYFVEARYGEAPFQTRNFLMDERGGVMVQLQVMETTSDPSVVRGAMQYVVEPRENDKVQVVQIFEVAVSGDKAFWDPEGTVIEGVAGASQFTPLRPAEAWLDHEESAPFATIASPLPPGERVNISVGYLLDHDGTLDFEWKVPFDVVMASAIYPEDVEFEAPGATPSEHDPGGQIPDDMKMVTFGEIGRGQPIAFEVSGMPRTPPVFRNVALGGAAVMGVLFVFAALRAPRASAGQRLAARRDELLALLEKTPSGPEGERRRATILDALDKVYRQLEALENLREGQKKKA